jgi:hypothetical protein
MLDFLTHRNHLLTHAERGEKDALASRMLHAATMMHHGGVLATVWTEMMQLGLLLAFGYCWCWSWCASLTLSPAKQHLGRGKFCENPVYNAYVVASQTGIDLVQLN